MAVHELLAVDMAGELGDALSHAFGMFWEILWALILGFAISAPYKRSSPKRRCAVSSRTTPRARSGSPAGWAPRAPPALMQPWRWRARSSPWRQLTAAMVFEFASTNLVIERRKNRETRRFECGELRGTEL
jgi:hypothetical protein